MDRDTVGSCKAVRQSMYTRYTLKSCTPFVVNELGGRSAVSCEYEYLNIRVLVRLVLDLLPSSLMMMATS